MANRVKRLTAVDFQVIGQQHGSDAVSREAREAAGRLRRDLASLVEYGYGPAAEAQLLAKLAQHDAALASRPTAVAAKRETLRTRDEARAKAWAWSDKVLSLLEPLAREDDTFALALHAAAPTDDSDLHPKMASLASLLSDQVAKLPPESKAADRMKEVETLRAGIGDIPASVANARAASVADTVEIDRLDGALYVFVRDLNAAARRAIRNGDLKAQQSEYRFHYLNRSGHPSAPAQEPPAPTPLPPTSTVTPTAPIKG